MLRIKKAIPHLFTSGNLLCGVLAIHNIYTGDLVWAAYLVGIACLLDFFDGFVARLLKVGGEFGKQLDSLADMVTFGVVPGVMMFNLIDKAEISFGFTSCFGVTESPLRYVAFIIPIFSALRLAKFNIDTRQSDSFIGVPTPANAILVCALPLILHLYTNYNMYDHHLAGLDQFDSTKNILSPFLLHKFNLSAALIQLILNPVGLSIVSITMSFLLVAELPLFALKFKHFKWKGNEIRFSFLILCLVLLLLLQFIALPLIIVLYVLMSLIANLKKAQKAG